MRDPYAGSEVFLAKVERLIEVGADERDILRAAAVADVSR